MKRFKYPAGYPTKTLAFFYRQHHVVICQPEQEL